MSLVLIHGSHLTGGCWSLLAPHLVMKPLAVNLPGRRDKPLEDEPLTFKKMADSVIADMDAAGLASATIIGHSWAGEVLRVLASLYPKRINHLVFISAAVLRNGECLYDPLDPAVQESLKNLRTQGVLAFEYPRDVATAVCNDMNQAQLDFALKELVPDSIAPFFEIVADRPWPSDSPACTYIKLSNDVVFTEDLQDRFIAQLPKPQVISFDAGHIAMLSRPAELATVLNTIARESTLLAP